MRIYYYLCSGINTFLGQHRGVSGETHKKKRATLTGNTFTRNEKHLTNV